MSPKIFKVCTIVQYSNVVHYELRKRRIQYLFCDCLWWNNYYVVFAILLCFCDFWFLLCFLRFLVYFVFFAIFGLCCVFCDYWFLLFFVIFGFCCVFLRFLVFVVIFAILCDLCIFALFANLHLTLKWGKILWLY